MWGMPNLKNFKSKEEYLQYYRNYRKKNALEIREYNRRYNREWRKKNGYHNEKNYDKRYPIKTKARMMLAKAVRAGKIKREPCQVCGEKNAQAHHPDYKFPFRVNWLCPLHHKNMHKSIEVIPTLVLRCYDGMLSSKYERLPNKVGSERDGRRYLAHSIISNNEFIMNPNNPKEVGALGGKARWAKVSKKKRSEIMKKVAAGRFPKK